ncbi:MAG TPA: hypothetical protein VGS28_04125 [Candidatus Saccharimonadales bacterium]|nr:hypothetical protein [Candidatus Saccharimonadales bacterium]
MGKPCVAVIGGYSVPEQSMGLLAEAIDGLYRVDDVRTISFRNGLQDPDRLRRVAKGAVVIGHSAAMLALDEAQLGHTIKLKGLMTVDGAEPMSVPRLVRGGMRITSNEKRIMKLRSTPSGVRAAMSEQSAAAQREVLRHPSFHARVMPRIARLSSVRSVTMAHGIRRLDGQNLPAVCLKFDNSEFGFQASGQDALDAQAEGVRLDTVGGDPNRVTHNALLWNPYHVLGMLGVQRIGLERRDRLPI